MIAGGIIFGPMWSEPTKGPMFYGDINGDGVQDEIEGSYRYFTDSCDRDYYFQTQVFLGTLDGVKIPYSHRQVELSSSFPEIFTSGEPVGNGLFRFRLIGHRRGERFGEMVRFPFFVQNKEFKVGDLVLLPDGTKGRIWDIAVDINERGQPAASLAYYVSGNEDYPKEKPVPIRKLQKIETLKTLAERSEYVAEGLRKTVEPLMDELDRIDAYSNAFHKSVYDLCSDLDFQTIMEQTQPENNWLYEEHSRVVNAIAEAIAKRVSKTVKDSLGQTVMTAVIVDSFGLPEAYFEDVKEKLGLS